MKFNLNWLKDYVSAGVSADKLAERLTMAGLEVEDIQNVQNDKVVELEVTPNRADCLSIVGIAREVSAVFNKKLDLPQTKKFRLPSKKCNIIIQDKKACSLYIGTVIENVKVKQSPLWMQKRLGPLGFRSVNNLVDITNFCMIESGQPLHAFDYDKIEGSKIIVRRAQKGESIVAIDGQEYKLDPSILVIADARKPIAIAGIMGGKDTEVTKDTKNILLESAHFDPVITRRASRKLGLSSDSSYRFERGVDYFSVEAVSKRVTQLILTDTQGIITKHKKVVGKKHTPPKQITISLDKIQNYIGAKIKFSDYRRILSALGFKVVKTKTSVKITPPPFRRDINYDVDIIEEVARVIGYDKLPMSMPKVSVNAMSNLPRRKQRENLRTDLIGKGLSDIITYSLISQQSIIDATQKDLKTIKIINPLSLDQEMMRPSLLPGMLGVAANNIRKNQKDIQLFEIGKVFFDGKEQEVLGLILSGINQPDWRELKQKEVGYYDLKGIVEYVVAKINSSDCTFEKSTEPFFEQGHCARFMQGTKSIGYLGKVNSQTLKNFDIKNTDVYFAQVNLEVLYDKVPGKKVFTNISDYPAVVRDVSLAVDKTVEYKEILSIVREEGGKLLSDIRFVEQYLGDKIEKGKRGLIFSLTYQSSERTLREEEVNSVHSKILDKLLTQLKAIQR